LNVNSNINNENQDCKIITVCVGGYQWEEGEDEGKRSDYGIWLMDFIYLHERELKKPLAIALCGGGAVLRGRDNGGNENNAQYKCIILSL
jgi:hypothetical protein